MKMNRSIMLDGSRVGTELDQQGLSINNTDLRLEGKEKEAVERLMRKIDADRHGKEWIFVASKNGSKMVLAMRIDARDDKRRYLNLSGNTLTFLTGENVVGNPDPIAQLVKCFKVCLGQLERKSGGKIPSSIYERVEREEFQIHSLEFAAYTGKLRDPDEVLNVLHGVFHLTYRSDMKKGMRSLAGRLNCHWVNSEFENSFRLKILEDTDIDIGTRRALYMFGMYDKTEELIARGGEISKGQLEFIENRLRIDLSFQYWWFHQNRIRSARELRIHVENKYGGSWVEFLRSSFKEIIKRIYLKEILEMDGKLVAEALEKKGSLMVGGKPVDRDLIEDILFARIIMGMDREGRKAVLSIKDNLKELIKDARNKVVAFDVIDRLQLVNKVVGE